MAKITTAIDWQKLVTDLQALSANGVAVAEVVTRLIDSLLNKRQVARDLRGIKPLSCDPGSFDGPLSILEEQRKNLTQALAANMSVVSDIEECISPGE